MEKTPALEIQVIRAGGPRYLVKDRYGVGSNHDMRKLVNPTSIY